MKLNWKIVIALIAGFALLSSKAFGQSSNSNNNAMVKLFLDSFTKAFGALNEAQAKSIAQIVLSFIANGDRDLRKLAYILATAWHESKLLLVKEKRAAPGTDVYSKQERYWNTGFYGRGYVQLTHESNYKKLGNVLGIDLVTNPDLALDRIYSADILVIGMLEGLFTGAALSRYINNGQADYINARKVVNGVDRADLIAGYTATIIKNMEYPIV